jgi:hypothetical protein
MNANKKLIPDWKWGTAEGSRELDRLLDRRLTFREKLEWLEEAEDLTLCFRANRERRAAEDAKRQSEKSPGRSER